MHDIVKIDTTSFRDCRMGGGVVIKPHPLPRMIITVSNGPVWNEKQIHSAARLLQQSHMHVYYLLVLVYQTCNITKPHT